MSEREQIVTIKGSNTLWYRIQHNWVGGDGPLSVALEGLVMIVMGLFFALLLPFSWLCDRWWRIYEPFERRRARQDR